MTDSAPPSPSAEAQRIVSASIDIDAAPSVVFGIVADPHQHPRIDGSGSLQGAIRGPEKLSRGADFGVDMKLFGLPYKIRNHVVEYDEDRRIAWRHFAGHRWRYELAPIPDGGTRVTESFDYSRYPRVAALLLEAARFPARNLRGIEQTLPRLKAAAEADA